jgi:hypothetical protein
VGSNPTLSATLAFPLVRHEAPAPLTPAAAIAHALEPHLPLSLGSLCVWGDWFGKPFDNGHSAVGVRHAGDDLTIEFDRREQLLVRRPEDWQLDPEARFQFQIRQSRLVIRRAERVEWGWFYYGRPQEPENWFEEHHWLEGGRVLASTTWTLPGLTFAPSADEPAVIFL